MVANSIGTTNTSRKSKGCTSCRKRRIKVRKMFKADIGRAAHDEQVVYSVMNPDPHVIDV
jgi:hypothetical protein